MNHIRGHISPSSVQQQFHSSDGPPTAHVKVFKTAFLYFLCVCASYLSSSMYGASMPCLWLVLWWSLAYVGTALSGGYTLRCLWYPLPHRWTGVVIIIAIHRCFMLFL